LSKELKEALDAIAALPTIESQITSGKAESIDTPDFAQMIRTIWLTASTSLAEDRLIEAVEEIKLYGLQQYVAGKRDMHETDVALMSTLSERIQQVEAERDHFKAIAERQAADTEKLKDALEIGRDAAYEVAQRFHEEMKGYREAEHKQVDADVATIEAAISLLSPAQQEPSQQEGGKDEYCEAVAILHDLQSWMFDKPAGPRQSVDRLIELIAQPSDKLQQASTAQQEPAVTPEMLASLDQIRATVDDVGKSLASIRERYLSPKAVSTIDAKRCICNGSCTWLCSIHGIDAKRAIAATVTSDDLRFPGVDPNETAKPEGFVRLTPEHEAELMEDIRIHGIGEHTGPIQFLTEMELQATPEGGQFVLTAPDGRQWKAETAFKCAAAEQRDRIPPEVALKRISDAVDEEYVQESGQELPQLPIDTGLLRLAESWAYDFALGQSSPMERQRKWQLVQDKIAEQMRDYARAAPLQQGEK